MLDLVSQFLGSLSDFILSTGLAGIFALVTLVASLVGAVLAARRARGAANDARESASVATRTLHRRTNQYASDLVLKSDEALIAHPEVARYFKQEDAELPTDELTLALVLAIAEMRLDVAEAIWDHHDEFKLDDVAAWREWIHYEIQVSPAIRHEEVLDVEFYPSTRTLLACNGCAKPDEHVWSVEYGRELAREDLSKALNKVRTAARLCAEADAERGPRRRFRRFRRSDQHSKFLERQGRAAQHDLGKALGELATTEIRCGVARAMPVIESAQAAIDTANSDSSALDGAISSCHVMTEAVDQMRVRVAISAGASSGLLDTRSQLARLTDRIMGESAPNHLTRDVRELITQSGYQPFFAQGQRKSAEQIATYLAGDPLRPGDESVGSAVHEA